MSEIFNIEIISPDKTILKSEAKEVIIPSYEGLMGILKDHIPLITFLRPGLMIIKSDINEKTFFIEEGIVEFSNNSLLILSSTVQILDSINKNFLLNEIEDCQKKFKSDDVNDKEKYLLSHKIDTLKAISQ